MRKIVLAIYVIISVIVSLPIMLIINIFNKKEQRSYLFNKIFLRNFSIIFLKILNVELNIQSETENYQTIENTLIVANHRSFVDIIVAEALFATNMIFISKKENHRLPFLSMWIREKQTIMIDRQDIRGSIKKLQEASVVIKEQQTNVFIFPQGTRNNNTVDFKAGSLKIAEMAKTPILPIAFGETNKIIKGNIFKKLVINVNVLQVINPVEYENKKMVELQNEIQTAIFQKN